MTNEKLEKILWHEYIPACNDGKVEKVKEIFITYPEYVQELCKYPNALPYSVTNNHIELVRFFLTTPTIKDNFDITAKNHHCIKLACQSGNLNMVKFLCNLEQVQEVLFLYQNLGANTAVSYDRKNLVEYFLTDNLFAHLGTKEAVQQLHDYIFKEAFYYEHTNILKFLINDFRIEKTSEITTLIEESLKSRLTKHLAHEINDLFIIRNYKVLENKIKEKSENNKEQNKEINRIKVKI